MNPTDPPDRDLPCTELVQLITAYLDGALSPDERTGVDRHLQGCAGCRTAIAQWRTVITLAGRLTEADVQTTDELTRDRLLSLCRGLRRR
jgi:anti-sigma factor RsiW